MKKEEAERYSVYVWTDKETNRVVKTEWRDSNGKLHNSTASKFEGRNPSSSGRTLHSDTTHWRTAAGATPAIVVWDERADFPVEESWFEKGELHRTGNLPAYIARDPISGITISEKYYKDGKLHRDLGPAKIERDAESGIATSSIWMQNGKAHRATDKPAEIERDSETGVVTREAYFRNGLWHREKLPAVIERDPRTGAVTYQEFYEHGGKVSPSQKPRYPAP